MCMTLHLMLRVIAVVSRYLNRFSFKIPTVTIARYDLDVRDLHRVHVYDLTFNAGGHSSSWSLFEPVQFQNSDFYYSAV
jgi:hypothetical protein